MKHPASEERWISDLAEDIHAHLREREKKRFRVRGRSTQIHLRPRILEYLNVVCYLKSFCVPVQHLALYLMDALMEGNLIEEEHWRLMLLGCLSVAVKLEENSDLIPSNKELCYLLDTRYLPGDIKHVELCTLDYFDWDVLVPTAAHFAEYYEMHAIVPTSDGLRLEKEEDYRLLKECMRCHVEYFLFVTLEDIRFYNYKPSMIAASCIASSRLNMMLIPSWPKAMRDITQYQFNELKPCIKMLLNELNNDTMMAKYRKGGHRSLKHISSLTKSKASIPCS